MNQMDLSVCSCFLFLCFLMFFVDVFISQCDLGVLYVSHWTLKTAWFCPSQDGYSNGSWICGLERLVLVRVDFYQFAECGSWTSVDDDGLSAILLWTPGTAPLETLHQSLHPSCHFCHCWRMKSALNLYDVYNVYNVYAVNWPIMMPMMSCDFRTVQFELSWTFQRRWEPDQLSCERWERQTRRQTETRQRRQRENGKHNGKQMDSCPTKRALTRQVCWNLFDLFLLACALTDVIKEVRIRTWCRFGTSEYKVTFRFCPLQQHTAIQITCCEVGQTHDAAQCFFLSGISMKSSSVMKAPQIKREISLLFSSIAAYCYLYLFVTFLFQRTHPTHVLPCSIVLPVLLRIFHQTFQVSSLISFNMFQYSHTADRCQVITQDPNALSGSSLLRLCRLVRLVRIIKAKRPWIHLQIDMSNTFKPLFSFSIFLFDFVWYL